MSPMTFEKLSNRFCPALWLSSAYTIHFIKNEESSKRSPMKMVCKSVFLGMCILAVVAVPVFSAAQTGAAPAGASSNAQPANVTPVAPRHLPPEAAAANAPRTIAPYFTRAKSTPKAPDADGFLQRWLLLEPIVKPNRTNTVFTGTYVRSTSKEEYFPGQFTVVPRDGEKAMVGDQELAWHALDSNLFDVKLFNFAYGLNKPTYGVIFWAVTIVNSPREMKNVRLAVGSNSASMWWVNGQDAADLFGDRRMVMDDVVSNPLTLKKGPNIIRGAVINGPGLSDFCVRLIDESGKSIKDLAQSLP